MKLTFPHMGNIYIPVKALLDDLGIEYIIPPINNKKALELGTKYAPEMACLPLKINIGNYIQARAQGADTVLIAGGCGPCRFGYYCEMQREILKDIGQEMDVIILEMPDAGIGEFIKRIKKLTGDNNIYKIIKAIGNTTQISSQVDDMERLCFKIRPGEIVSGDANKIYKAFLNNAMQIKGSVQIKKMIKKTINELMDIDVDKNLKPLKVGIVGEIYTAVDSYANHNIEEKLGNMGVEVDRSITVGSWIKEHIIKNALKLPRDLRYAKAAKPYLPVMIGGHAQETIGNTVLYARGGYDGVIQIFPLTCMPEIVAESILPSVERDFDIPVLTLVIDEMTGEAGYLTRIEAFVDLLFKRRERAVVDGSRILPGH